MADLAEIVISKKQAQEFAKAIYSDIDDYVKSHQKEFEEFLREERKEVTDVCPDTE